MKNVDFIVYKNDRLKFEDSDKVVEDFIKKRLTYFNANSISFIDKSDIDTVLAKLSNDINYIVVFDVMNPIIDLDLIQYAISHAIQSNSKVFCVEGAVPGTQFEFILAPGFTSLDSPITLRYFSQDRYNNQFNLYKYKRLKMFITILELDPQIYTYTIEKFIDFLCRKDVFERIVAFGESIPLTYYSKCPHCQGELISLPMKTSQAFCGYIPSSQPLYHECTVCNLVGMSPHVEPNQTYKLYDKYDKQDFVVSQSNPYCEGAVRCDFSAFFKLLPEEVKSLDLGGGIGNFSRFLKEKYKKWDVTHSDFVIKQNEQLENDDINTRAINFLKDEIAIETYDLITAWEVIEHIPYENLNFVLDNIYRALKPGGLFVFSTPNFDSPLCKVNDFYGICPPFHYLVFGKIWLENYFKQDKKWNIVSTSYFSDFAGDSDMWCDYAAKTAPSFQLRATAQLLKVLMKSEENKKLLLKNGMGTEIIMVL